MNEGITREKVLRERVYRMQTFYGQGSNSLNQQSPKVALIAILLFAFSGLISGFAVGAFVHHKTGTTHNNNTGTGITPIAQNTGTPVSTTAPEVVWLGEPKIQYPDIGTQRADGSTSYTLSTLIVDKSDHPIQASDVTCKLWLTKDGNATAMLSANNYAVPKAIDAIQQPFQGEVVGGLTFSTTQQAQPCTPNGNTTWNYTISPSVDPGTYYLVVLADWKGKHYNWSWVIIKIKQGASH